MPHGACGIVGAGMDRNRKRRIRLIVATTAAVAVGYYGAVATYRLGLDPDNHGIPIVTSSLDFLGAVSLILAIVILGLT